MIVRAGSFQILGRIDQPAAEQLFPQPIRGRLGKPAVVAAVSQWTKATRGRAGPRPRRRAVEKDRRGDDVGVGDFQAAGRRRRWRHLSSAGFSSSALIRSSSAGIFAGLAGR